MNIVVCVKRVPDPEAPATLYKLDAAAGRLVPARSVPWLTSTYDESALEAALQLKDAVGGQVTLVSLASEEVTEWLQEVLATGADEAVLVQDAALAAGDDFTVAATLAAAIRKLGDVDLVLCGRQASDTDAGIVGPALAEYLGMPSVAVARKVEQADGALRVERALDDGYEVLAIDPPAVLAITSELYQLRYATMPNIMAASMKDIPVWTAADLDLAPPARLVEQQRLHQPEARVACEVITADTEEDAARLLAQALRARGVI